MFAIKTRYIAMTGSRGSQIRATALEQPEHGKRQRAASIPYPHHLSGVAVHRAALRVLLAKLEKDAAEYWTQTGRPQLIESDRARFDCEKWITAWAGDDEMVHIWADGAYTAADDMASPTYDWISRQ